MTGVLPDWSVVRLSMAVLLKSGYVISKEAFSTGLPETELVTKAWKKPSLLMLSLFCTGVSFISGVCPFVVVSIFLLLS